MAKSPAASSAGAIDMVDLVGVGLNATDMLIPLAHHPEQGSKVEYQTATILPGGRGRLYRRRVPALGFAHTLCRRSSGQDDFGSLHAREFARTTALKRGSSPSPRAPVLKSIILVNPEGNAPSSASAIRLILEA